MWLDAILVYLHYAAILMLFSFLTVRAILIRRALDAPTVRLLGRTDLWYGGARSPTTRRGRFPPRSSAARAG